MNGRAPIAGRLCAAAGQRCWALGRFTRRQPGAASLERPTQPLRAARQHCAARSGRAAARRRPSCARRWRSPLPAAKNTPRDQTTHRPEAADETMRANPRISANYVDGMMAQRRVHDAQVKGLLTFAEESSRLSAAARNEQKLVDKRRAAQMNSVQAEMRMDQMIAEQERKSAMDVRISSQNQKLAVELERRKADAERKQREVQRICEESEDLKNLEQRLKVAYMNKERAAQHEEKQVLQRLDRQREQAIEDQMEYDRQMAENAEYEKNGARRMVGLHQKAALQQQILEREELLREAEEEATRDKAMVDAVITSINDEDQADIMDKTKKREATRRQIKDYEKLRKVQVEEAVVKSAKEEAEIRQYTEAMAKREADIRHKAAEKKKREELAFYSVVQQTENSRKADEELEHLRNMLWEEEVEAARRKADKDRETKRANDKIEMKTANDRTLRLKKESAKVMAAEEERLVGIMLDKFKEDERAERAAEVERGDRKQEYISNIGRQREERIRMYETEKAAEMYELDAQKAADEYKARVIAEARRRLLQEHANALEGFLPKNTLATQADSQMLRDSRNREQGQGGM